MNIRILECGAIPDGVTRNMDANGKRSVRKMRTIRTIRRVGTTRDLM